MSIVAQLVDEIQETLDMIHTDCEGCKHLVKGRCSLWSVACVNSPIKIWWEARNESNES